MRPKLTLLHRNPLIEIEEAIDRARDEGVPAMVSFFMSARDPILHLGVPFDQAVEELGLELLKRLRDGENIDPIIVYHAMGPSVSLREAVAGVAFERFANNIPSLTAVMSTNDHLFTAHRQRALAQLHHLHQHGQRISYREMCAIVKYAPNVVVDERSYQIQRYFEELEKRIRIQRCQRRIHHVWQFYTDTIKTKRHTLSLQRLEQLVHYNTYHWAKLPFKEACNKLFECLMQDQHPFPKSP